MIIVYKQKFISTVYENSVLGEYAVINDVVRSATAIALNESTLLTVEKHVYNSYLKVS
jgi:hypothetical protein